MNEIIFQKNDLKTRPVITKQILNSRRWTVADILKIFEQPFSDLILQAQAAHRQYFEPNRVQLSTLLSIKKGGCSEDCSYCPQSAKYQTGVKAGKLIPVIDVIKAARLAKEKGATRFCMGAAWRNLKQRDLETILKMIVGVKALGMETCVTLGMLEADQALALKQAGLDYYNHNLDTSPEFYGQIISTRTYQDRLETLKRIRDSGIHVCCGGIIGLGESRRERAGLIAELANLVPYPESVPINNLVKVTGTPLAHTETIDPFEFVRMIAVTKIIMPKATVRLSAGREQMDDGVQALCFLAGASSIFYGDQLLTTSNPQILADQLLMNRLNLKPL